MRPQPAHLLHRKQRDRGERQAQQQAARRKAPQAGQPHAEQHPHSHHRVTRHQQVAAVPAHRHAHRQQRTQRHAQAKQRPKQVQPDRAGQHLAGDHWQKGGGDDVAKAGQAVGQREQRHAAVRRCGFGRPGRRRYGHRAVQVRPGNRAERSGQQRKHRPAGGCVPTQCHHGAGGQPAGGNAQPRADKDEAGQRRCTQRRQPRQAPAGDIDEHQRAGHARQQAPQRPQHRQRQGHAQGEQHGGDQAGAHRSGVRQRHLAAPAPPQCWLQGAGCGTDPVAQVVGSGQPAGAAQVDHAVVQHHRQQRRERKAADAHRHGQRQQAGQRDRHRPGCQGRCRSGVRRALRHRHPISRGSSGQASGRSARRRAAPPRRQQRCGDSRGHAATAGARRQAGHRPPGAATGPAQRSR